MSYIKREDAVKALWKSLYQFEDEMEKKFIESEELKTEDWFLHRIFVQNMSDIDRHTILNLPAADVVERKKGKWIDGVDIPETERKKHPYVYLHWQMHCSACWHEAYYDTDYGQQLFDYCPNCGADMRGEEDV